MAFSVLRVLFGTLWVYVQMYPVCFSVWGFQKVICVFRLGTKSCGAGGTAVGSWNSWLQPWHFWILLPASQWIKKQQQKTGFVLLSVLAHFVVTVRCRRLVLAYTVDPLQLLRFATNKSPWHGLWPVKSGCFALVVFRSVLLKNSFHTAVATPQQQNGNHTLWSQSHVTSSYIVLNFIASGVIMFLWLTTLNSETLVVIQTWYLWQ